MNKKIAIIGGGNLGTAIAEGLINSGFEQPQNIIITKRNIATLQSLKDKGACISNDNNEAANFADYIILAIKPFQIKEVLEKLKPSLNPKKHVLVSVVTGVWVKDMQEILGNDFAIFRAMPNTAIAIQQSMTCISESNASTEQTTYVTNVFNQLGKTVFIEEKLMDAATVLAACGTAYAMRYMRANIQGGIEIGFSAATASLIAAQTVKGAAQLLIENNSHPEAEIDKVTTPKGVTITGLNQMEHNGLSSSVTKGITEAYKKMNP